MPNELEGNAAAPEQNVPTAPEDSQVTPPPAPADLAEAFAQLRESNAQAAQGGVEDSGDNAESIGKHAKHAAEQPKQAEPEQQASAPAEAATEESAQSSATSEPSQQQADTSVGGAATSSEPVDYTPARQQIYQGINQQAVQNVAKRFQDNGIRMWEIGDLYEKDEQSGRVTFKNPDDPNHDFASRKEAQDFVDAMNRQINNKFQSEIRQEQAKLLEQARPSLSMIDFVPVYQGMSEAERGVFDDLITPYAVRDANNNIVGFNTDLGAAANQARAIAARFASAPQAATQAKQPEQTEPTSPATDMTTGAGEVASDEPKDLSEAFALLNKQKKEGKKND